MIRKSSRFWSVLGLLLVSLFWSPARSWSSESSEKVSVVGAYRGYSEELYRRVVTKAVYVPMRDGVRLAVDYMLPRGLPASEKIPALLIQTRYWRSMVLPLMKDASKEYLVRHGYAVVTVDVRGTGASSGSWPYPWSEAEIKDGAEIVDWIIAQPWSNGRVGSYGTSYTATTAEFLLVNRHPAVKAVVVRFGLFDAYADIAYPGGIYHDWFMDTWNRLDQALDRNDTGRLLQMMKMVKPRLIGLPGVKPAGPPLTRMLDLQRALQGHQQNGDVYEFGKQVEFRDVYFADLDGAIEKISPYFYQAQIEASGAPIYFMTGWLDGAYTAAMINNYLNFSNAAKLTVGPWPHGGRENISPWRDSVKPEFDQSAELLRFFDYHLKGLENGVMDEPPVHYFTMGEEQWKGAEVWPPAAKTMTFFLAGDHSLSPSPPSSADGFDSYQVNYDAGTGIGSRYNSLVNLPGTPIWYPDRAAADQRLLVYESAPLLKDLEVTGHPVARLYVKSTADDGQFFVYLEDVSPGGTVSYITEGLLRGQCREVSPEPPLYQTAPGVPYHTFKSSDARPLVPGEVALITFDLQPTSVRFRAGHRIRVAVSGADKDHFVIPQDPAPRLEVQRNSQYPSSLDLPMVE